MASNPDRAPLPWALSFLAPAALVILPMFALAFAPGKKDEAYEWTQHALVGAGFAAAFAGVFLFGPWRQSWPTSIAAIVTLAVVALVTQSGLPGPHILFVAAGGMVALGYRFALRRDPPMLLETVAVGFISILSFWAASRLSWWQPFDITFAGWPSRILFICTTALLVWVLCNLDGNEQETGSGKIWVSRLIDVATLAVLAAAVLRTTDLQGNPYFPHHWGVFVAPAEMVREGRTLLGEVPSQYGFLSTLVLAAVPTDNCFTALYWLNCSLVWASGFIVYFTLKTWLARWWWQLAAGLITVCCVAFLCGDASTLSGPIVFPSVGAVRFIWLHILLGFLLWQHQVHRAAPFKNSRRLLWIGSAIWLLGVLWSVESAVYVTAAWLPAASLLAMRPAVESLSWSARVRALLAGISRALGVTSIMLAATVVMIGCYYQLVLQRSPDWRGYWEYAIAFSGGFGVLPIQPQGAVWVLVLLHIALLASLVSTEIDRRRRSIALVWAAWGALWAVSTYYVSRSHPNNITNLSPVLLLILGLMVHASRNSDLRSLARPWIWLTVPSFTGGVLWLVLTNPAALRSQLSGYFVQPHAAQLLTSTPPDLDKLIAQCMQQKPARYSVFGFSSYDVVRAEVDSDHKHWLPLRSTTLYSPLPQQRRDFYLDSYSHERSPGWLIAPSIRKAGDLHWVFNYIESRYTLQMSLENKGWQAWYYIPRGVPSQPLEGAGHLIRTQLTQRPITRDYGRLSVLKQIYSTD